MDWIDCNKQMPKRVCRRDSDDNLCLAWWQGISDGYCVIVSVNFIKRKKKASSGYTHWMPLPEPPPNYMMGVK